MNPWSLPADKGVPDRPSVFLLASGDCSSEQIADIGAGCEEEGVPLTWATQTGKAGELAKEAAIRSRLEVGIGLGNGEAVVTFRKLDSPCGYVRFSIFNREDVRNAGRTAGRLVKREPLPLEGRPDGDGSKGIREVRS